MLVKDTPTTKFANQLIAQQILMARELASLGKISATCIELSILTWVRADEKAHVQCQQTMTQATAPGPGANEQMTSITAATDTSLIHDTRLCTVHATATAV